MLVEQIELSDEDFRVDANEGVGIVLNYRDAEVSKSSLDEFKDYPSSMEHQSSIGASFKEKGDSDVWAGRSSRPERRSKAKGFPRSVVLGQNARGALANAVAKPVWISLVRRFFRDGVLLGLGIVCDADYNNAFGESCPGLDEHAAFSWLRLWSN
jgi:hypothetical protein